MTSFRIINITIYSVSHINNATIDYLINIHKTWPSATKNT
jgi:hypothetical protein